MNPSDVMSINDIAGEFSTENRSTITIRNGDKYSVTEYASTVAEKINSALEKQEVHPPIMSTGDTPKGETLTLPRAIFT